MNRRELLDKLSATAEERVLLGRLWDGWERCRSRNIPEVSGFLSPHEQALALTREKVGDILVSPQWADVLVGSSVTEHLLREWTQAGRVHLQVERIDPAELLIPAEQTKLLRDTVASLRLDSVLAAGFAVGRSAAADLIRSGKAEVNWMPCDKPDTPVRQGDVLTVRGLGKCLLEEVGGQSRKGRTAITMKRFI